MATFNVGSGETYSTLQTCFAAGVLADGDTVQLAAGYDVNETCTISGVNNVTLVGNVTDPTQAVITWDNPSNTNYVLTLNLNNLSGWVIKGITLNYTGSGSVWSGAFFGGWTGSAITVEDCRINTSGRYGFVYHANGSVFKRCEMVGTTSTATNCQALGLTKTVTIESCLIRDFGHYHAQLGDGSTVKSSTFYNGRAAADCSTGHAIYTHAIATLNNVLIWNNHTKALRRGVVSNYPSQVTVTGSIIWGSASADGGTGGIHPTSTLTDVLLSADVGAAAVLSDVSAGNFYPDAGGLADGAGSATYTPAGGDLNRQAFNNPPSIGCLEILPAPASEPVQPSPTAPYVSAVFMAVDCSGASAPVIVGGTVETWDASQLTATHATAWEVITSFCDWFTDSGRGWASSNITATPSTAKMSGGKITISIALSSSVVVVGNAAFQAVAGFGVAFGTTLGGTAAAPCAWSALTTIRNAAQPSPTGGGGLTSGGGWVVGDHPTAPKATEAEGILTPAEAIAMAEALATAPNPRIAHIYNAQAKAFERCKLGAIDTTRGGELYRFTAGVICGG